MPDNVETIGRLFTYECTNLETLTVGESLRRFNYYGFLLGNPKLKTLIWNAIRTEEKTFDAYHATDACMAPIEQFITGDKVEYIPGQLFWKNKTLTEVKLGKSVKEIGEAAFRECKFTSIKFPESLKKIGAHAFYRTPLEFIIIPESVTGLGVWCLGGTPAKTIISCPTDAPSEKSSFIDSDAETHFYVPDINSYLSNWNQYGSKIKPIAIADKYEFTSDDANPAPVFTSNIPGYKIAYYETPGIDTANGAHSIKVRMDFTGTYGMALNDASHLKSSKGLSSPFRKQKSNESFYYESYPAGTFTKINENEYQLSSLGTLTVNGDGTLTLNDGHSSYDFNATSVDAYPLDELTRRFSRTWEVVQVERAYYDSDNKLVKKRFLTQQEIEDDYVKAVVVTQYGAFVRYEWDNSLDGYGLWKWNIPEKQFFQFVFSDEWNYTDSGLEQVFFYNDFAMYLEYGEEQNDEGYYEVVDVLKTRSVNNLSL